MDYILRNAPKVNAELYCIENGDHTFVVINRKPGSNPANPLTWGNAIICDPWANRIYLAKDYLENLLYFRMVVFHNDKNEYIYQRALEKFNPDQHILAPEHNQNTAYLRLHRNSQNLIINFNNKVSGFKIAIIGFINQLEALHKNAIAVFGESNPKMVFLNKRLEKSRVLLEKMDNLPNVLQQVYASNDYRLVRKKLNKIIIAIYTTIESLRLTDMQTRMYNPTVQKQSSPTSDTSKDHKSTNKP